MAPKRWNRRGQDALSVGGNVVPHLARRARAARLRPPSRVGEGEVQPDHPPFLGGGLLEQPVSYLLAAPPAAQGVQLAVDDLGGPDVLLGPDSAPGPVDG